MGITNTAPEQPQKTNASQDACDFSEHAAEYRGRFAPSPTGPLHLGSLVAALGSFLRARSQGGRWLLRIEDLDPPRELPGAGDAIRRALEAHGLLHDEAVRYQSERFEAYVEALTRLQRDGIAYPCDCSRQEIRQSGRVGAEGVIYSGKCRTRSIGAGKKPPAWRVIVPDQPIIFVDQRCGRQTTHLASDIGDFVVKRADGLFAYQLAVTVDDAFQGISEVVRGEDLLSNTGRQWHLQTCLGYPHPQYLHLPLVRNAQGQKLSKQNLAPALDSRKASENLMLALQYLGLAVPRELQLAPPKELLTWAISSFTLTSLPPRKRSHCRQQPGKG